VSVALAAAMLMVVVMRLAISSMARMDRDTNRFMGMLLFVLC